MVEPPGMDNSKRPALGIDCELPVEQKAINMRWDTRHCHNVSVRVFLM